MLLVVVGVVVAVSMVNLALAVGVVVDTLVKKSHPHLVA
jgi:hypothetical protein